MQYNEALYIRKFRPLFNFRHNPDAYKIERICLSKYLNTYDTLNSFSKAIDIPQNVLIKFFQSNSKEVKKYSERITRFLFPNGGEKDYFKGNPNTEINLNRFKHYGGRKRTKDNPPNVLYIKDDNGNLVEVGSLNKDKE